ncbi:hypothetical protein K7640_21295 [Micromonospora sp. PLK6-60]|uniref:hypothetical protein n=1 Tax=Micromonospora sp. PLK6-60 TaxID=2873383 RepID=UPI001CA6CAB2|nr:hypothetical protein [Micromonospora sp. PLK6-60]MBY8874370.1 hypothetical protein [Micromonospora sp. PLK6-60]
MDNDLELWQNLAARHRQCDDDARRCRDCQAYWPCAYRLDADRHLLGTIGAATLPGHQHFVFA